MIILSVLVTVSLLCSYQLAAVLVCGAQWILWDNKSFCTDKQIFAQYFSITKDYSDHF